MSKHAAVARKAMKSKAHKMAEPHKGAVDASGWTEPTDEEANVQTGMRPVSKRQYKRGGKVAHHKHHVGHAEGHKAHERADRKPRKAGGKAEMPPVDRFINADKKKANEYRDGPKHVGGMKRGGRAEKMDGGGLYGAGLGTNVVRARGGKAGHPDEAEDRALVKKMVKGAALTGKAAGGEAGGKWIQSAIKRPGALHKALHVPAGEKIPAKKLAKAAHSDNPKMAKRANLAMTLKRIHKKEAGYVSPKVDADDLDIYKNPKDRRYTTGPVTFAPDTELPIKGSQFYRDAEYNVGRKRGGKADHGAGCRCHKCMGGKAGKARGGASVTDGSLEGTRPTGGRLARAEGGPVQLESGKKGRKRPAGMTVNIDIETAPKKEQPGMMQPGMLGHPFHPSMGAPPGGPAGAPPVPPPPGPMMPPAGLPGAGAGGPPIMPPMARKSGGRTVYPDMEFGAGGGKGRKEKIKEYGP